MGKVLSVSKLKKIYEVRKTAFSLKREIIKAVDDVSFELEKGKTLGVVGESGSGKSTLARCVLLLEVPDDGTVTFLGNNLGNMGRNELKGLRKDMQIIFQDPYSSLNPRRKVYETIAEPILFHNIVPKNDVKDKVMEIFKSVGLDEDFVNKYPHEMSGGQRQRVAIGRALATNPILVIADEPVSSLDVSIQAQIVNLFIDIRESADISMLFVSHDLNVVRFISDEIMASSKGFDKYSFRKQSSKSK
jgi:ABC-type oligopeptide transport system ATPase subunit